ncbi:MAG: tetratricopeptide repeat protein [Deltaproteobacteria bacterium]|nr:tetratricopeptide repeat protein [Deltaproteobacteria bacterium]
MEQVLIEVIKINPNTVNVYNSLGIVYRRQGKFEEAVQQYKKALRVNPEDENIFYNLSRVYLMLNDPEKAKEAVTKATEINPDFKEAHDLLKSIDMNLSSK